MSSYSTGSYIPSCPFVALQSLLGDETQTSYCHFQTRF